jgi:ppGpp synthetase/RelA/SpoT-type nucleotidyltranferase
MKPNHQEYLATQASELGFVENNAAARYKLNMASAHAGISESGFIQDLVRHLNDIRTEYGNGLEKLLFIPHRIDDLPLLTKPWESVVGKSFRKNVVLNDIYPAPPIGGWIEASNIYDRVKDLIRCRLICRYLDGPAYVAKRIEAFCDERKIGFEYESMGSERGYYAWHCYFTLPATYDVGGNIQDGSVKVELQLITQLADVLESLTHKLYENERGSDDAPHPDWKWQSETDKFKAAYIGHGLHLLEGVIQKLKDDVLKAQKPEETSPRTPE